jgi:single-stranded-DNA-specific exonuclease
MRDVPVRYGGHSQAAVFTLEHSKINEFTKRLFEYAEKNKLMLSVNTITIENELKISDINLDFYKQLKIIKPFGIGSLRPIFCMKNISSKGSKNVQAVF